MENITRRCFWLDHLATLSQQREKRGRREGEAREEEEEEEEEGGNRVEDKFARVRDGGRILLEN